jgi:hypothetical protein
MDKHQVENLINDVVNDLNDNCPHCNSRTHITKLFSASFNDNHDLIYYFVFRCVPCKSLIVKTYKFRGNNWNNQLENVGWISKFPSPEIAVSNDFKEYLPENIFEDLKEGTVNFSNNCFKSSVVMFRRSLQNAMINLGADKEKDLIDQIKSLDIPNSLKDWAHNIRIFGNRGSHPQQDNLKEITKEIAEDVKKFIDEFFNYSYVMPGRVIKARDINSKKKDKK